MNSARQPSRDSTPGYRVDKNARKQPMPKHQEEEAECDLRLVELFTQTNPILPFPEILRQAAKLKKGNSRRRVLLRLRQIGSRAGDDELPSRVRHTGLRWVRLARKMHSFDHPDGWDGSMEELDGNGELNASDLSIPENDAENGTAEAVASSLSIPENGAENQPAGADASASERAADLSSDEHSDDASADEPTAAKANDGPKESEDDHPTAGLSSDKGDHGEAATISQGRSEIGESARNPIDLTEGDAKEIIDLTRDDDEDNGANA